MIIKSLPHIDDIRFGRFKGDPCSFVFLVEKDGAPMDLTDVEFRMVFTYSEKILLNVLPDVKDENRIEYNLTDQQKDALSRNIVDFYLKMDGITIYQGRLTWNEKSDGPGSAVPGAIKITINTVTGEVEGEPVIIGPKGDTGKSAWQYAVEKGYTGTEAEFAEEMAHLPEYAGETKGFRDEAEGFRDAAQTSATNAAGSATASENSASAASGSATNAGNAAGAAITARNEAETFAEDADNSAAAAGTSEENASVSATAAGNSASEAAGSATAAGNSKTAAESAASAALGHRNAAETAKSGAETAKAGAEAARSGAEAARDEVNATKDSFIRNNTDTFGAKVTAIVSLTQTEFDALPLKLNTTMYVISADPASVILQLVGLTQAEYDGLPVKDIETAYLIEYAA